MSKAKSRRKAKKKSAVKITALIIVFVVLVAAVSVFCFKGVLKRLYPVKYSNYIEKYSAEYNVPKELLYATISVESGFNPEAQSDAGAIGLTQITPDTLSWLQTKTGESYTEEDLKNPEIAIKYCAVFYSILLQKFGDVDTSVCAYHAGINAVSNWLKNSEYSADGKTLDKTPSAATNHYLSKIRQAINVYNNLYKEEL
jgi:soluble lytic murein transglycosylase